MENVHDDSATGDQKPRDAHTLRLLSIQRCLKHMVHACQCKDADCKLPECQKMKMVIQHCNTCNKKENGEVCPICRQMIALCCYHAKYCLEADTCSVLFCLNIKRKLRQQQLRNALQKTQTLKRHIIAMQNRIMSGGLLGPNPENSNCFSHPSPSASQPHPSPDFPESEASMKSSSGPPIGALLAVQQVQAAAAAQAQIQNPMPQMISSIPNYMMNMGNGASWENSGYVQNQQPHQNTQLGLQQPFQIVEGPYSVSSSSDSTMGAPQEMLNPGPSVGDMQRSTQDWQQLFQSLKISSTSSLPSPNSSYPEN